MYNFFKCTVLVYTTIIFLVWENCKADSHILKPIKVSGLTKGLDEKQIRVKIAKIRNVVATAAVLSTVEYFSSIIVDYSFDTAINKIRLWLGVYEDASIKHKHIQNMADDVTVYSNIPGKLRVYIARDGTNNAYTKSVFSSNPCIVINSGLLKNLNDEEICQVIAHEEGHIKHSDVHREVIKLSVVNGIVGAIGLSTNVKRVANIAYYYLNRMIGQRREYLADYHAATIVGPQVSINVNKKLHKLCYQESISNVGRSNRENSLNFWANLLDPDATHPQHIDRIKFIKRNFQSSYRAKMNFGPLWHVKVNLLKLVSKFSKG